MGTAPHTSHSSIYARFGKPLLDRTLGLVLALLTLPVVLALVLISWVAFGWPALQRLQRVGRNRKQFNLYRVNTSRTHQIDLRGRRLRLSRWLRSTSLDELPQLWNVVLGHMSLVGPRPIEPARAQALDPETARRHRVRPGVTGPWQVEARGDGRDLADHLSVDLRYVERLSLGTDLSILARTIPSLLLDREEM